MTFEEYRKATNALERAINRAVHAQESNEHYSPTEKQVAFQQQVEEELTEVLNIFIAEFGSKKM